MRKEITIDFDKNFARRVALASIFQPRTFRPLIIFVLVFGFYGFYYGVERLPQMLIPLVVMMAIMIPLLVAYSYWLIWKSWREFHKHGPAKYVISEEGIMCEHPMFSSGKTSWEILRYMRKSRHVIILMQVARLPIVLLPREKVDSELEAFLDQKFSKP